MRQLWISALLGLSVACNAPDLGDPNDASDVILGEDEVTSVGGTLRPHARGVMSRTWSRWSPGAGQQDFMTDNVVQVNWSALEASGEGTQPGGYFAAGTMGWATIEQALASNQRVRLRIRAGIDAPAYAKRIGFDGVFDGGGTTGQCTDGGVYVYNAWDDRGGCVPKYWMPWFLGRYRELMTEVARRFGNHPNLVEVVNSACMTNYAEPFYRAHKDAASNGRLMDAGLTFGKDVFCHQQAVFIHAKLFPSIRTSLAVNPWDEVGREFNNQFRPSWERTHAFLEGTGSLSLIHDRDGYATTRVWRGARHILGNRLVLQNNGLGEDEGCPSPTSATAVTSHYCYLSHLAKTTAQPIGFQTETMLRLRQAENNVGGPVRTEEEGVRMVLDRALSMSADSVELPSGFEDWVGTANDMLRSKDAALEANEN